MVTVFEQKFLNLFATDETFVLPIDPTESRIRLKASQQTERLSLSLNRSLLLGHCQHESGQTRTHHRRHLFIVALLLVSLVSSMDLLEILLG